MKKVSKIISMFMAAVLSLSIFAVSASAVATPLVAGNTKETATNIPTFGTEYVSELSTAGETDWFKFTTLSEDAYYTISLVNYNLHEGYGESYTVNLYLFDTYNKQLANLQNTRNTNVKLENSTTYYIRVNMGEFCRDSIGDYSFSVTCDSAKSLSKITIDSTPDKTTYVVGESFDKTGLKVTAHYSDGSTKAVTSCTVYGFDSSTAGTKTLTVSYTENDVTKTASFNITVKESDSSGGSSDTGFDFMAILNAILNFFVSIFNFFVTLFA